MSGGFGRIKLPTVLDGREWGWMQRVATECNPGRIVPRTDTRPDHTFHDLTPAQFIGAAAAGYLKAPSTYTHGDRWAGCNRDTAFYLAVHGWPDAVDAVKDVYDAVTLKHTRSLIPVFTSTDEPGDLDVGAWISREDEYYTDLAPSDVRSFTPGAQAVTISHSLFVSRDQTTEEILTRGAAVAALVHTLETAGVRTEIVLTLANRDWYTRNKYLLRITLKSLAEPPDMPRLMYWLAHPSVIRQLCSGLYSPYRSDGISYEPKLETVEDERTVVVPGSVNVNMTQWLDQQLARILGGE